MSSKVHDAAATADAEEGQVLLDGPGGLAIAMTPEAADETATAITAAAAVARGQRAARHARGEGES